MSRARRTRTQTVRAPAGVEIGDGPTPAGVPARGLVVHIDGDRGTVWRNGELLGRVREANPRRMLYEIGQILAMVMLEDELRACGFLPLTGRGRE